MDFQGRNVVVTGGTGVLGAAVVWRLVNAGAQVHVPAIEDEIPTDFGDRVWVTPGIDLANEAVVNWWYDGLPDLWASIHCAGGFAWRAFGQTDIHLLDAMLRINLRTAFLCSKAAVRRFQAASHGGRIVNVASRQALEPRQGSGTTAYTASKAAVAAFSAALAEEVASEDILVNCVAPAILDTATNRDAMPDADHASWARVEDVAEVMAFLASPANNVARGGTIPVYGRS